MTGRRPIAARGTAWAGGATRRLAAAGATPNAVSAAGLAAAVLAGLALLPGPETGWAVAAAGLIGLRLLCNMLDGMLAVEAGRGTPDGAFWNEIPDRLADIAVLLGAGYGAGAAELGWASALAALATAYVRAAGAALGAGEDFSGPLAKQQRMWAVAGAALAGALWPVLPWMEIALWTVALGAGLTAGLRAKRLRRRLLTGCSGTRAGGAEAR